MQNKLFPLLLFLAIIFLSALSSSAASMGPPGPPMGPPCWPPPCAVPLDGGISLLIAAGVALGGKKFYDRKKA